MRDSKNSEMKKMLAGTIALLMVVASVGVYQKWFSKTSKFDEDHIGECYYQEIQEEHVATDDLTMYTRRAGTAIRRFEGRRHCCKCRYQLYFRCRAVRCRIIQ